MYTAFADGMPTRMLAVTMLATLVMPAGPGFLLPCNLLDESLSPWEQKLRCGSVPLDLQEPPAHSPAAPSLPPDPGYAPHLHGPIGDPPVPWAGRPDCPHQPSLRHSNAGAGLGPRAFPSRGLSSGELFHALLHWGARKCGGKSAPPPQPLLSTRRVAHTACRGEATLNAETR